MISTKLFKGDYRVYSYHQTVVCLCFSDVLGSVLVIFVFVHVLLMCYPLQTSLSDMSGYVIPFCIQVRVFIFGSLFALVRVLNKILLKIHSSTVTTQTYFSSSVSIQGWQ